MTDRRRVTEYLVLDLEARVWRCHRCDREIGPAKHSYKEGCLLYDRDPRTLYQPSPAGEWTVGPDPAWCRIVEFYCPGCGTLIEAELLPPGHPITYDIELDLDALLSGARTGRPADTGVSPS